MAQDPSTVDVRSAAVLAPPLLWGAWMVAYGIAWSPELWAGVLGMASLSGLGLSILALPPTVPEAHGSRSQRHKRAEPG